MTTVTPEISLDLIKDAKLQAEARFRTADTSYILSEIHEAVKVRGGNGVIMKFNHALLPETVEELRSRGINVTLLSPFDSWNAVYQFSGWSE